MPDPKVKLLVMASRLDVENAGMHKRELNVQPTLKNTNRESVSILRRTKSIIENLNVLIKRQILQLIKRHFTNIVKRTVKKSTQKPENAECKGWSTFVQLDEGHVRYM